MSTLRLLSRVSVICNICFLFAIAILWIGNPQDSPLVSIVIVLGFVLAVIFNGIVNTWYLILVLLRKPLVAFVPKWMVLTNLAFLAAQLILLLR